MTEIEAIWLSSVKCWQHLGTGWRRGEQASNYLWRNSHKQTKETWYVRNFYMISKYPLRYSSVSTIQERPIWYNSVSFRLHVSSIFINNLDNAVEMMLRKWLQGYLSMKINLPIILSKPITQCGLLANASLGYLKMRNVNFKRVRWSKTARFWESGTPLEYWKLSV